MCAVCVLVEVDSVVVLRFLCRELSTVNELIVVRHTERRDRNNTRSVQISLVVIEHNLELALLRVLQGVVSICECNLRLLSLDSCDTVLCLTCDILEANGTNVHVENIVCVEVSKNHIVAIVAKRLDCELLRIVCARCCIECVFELVAEDLCLNY